MKKRVLMSLVLLIAIGTSAVFAQQATMDKLKFTAITGGYQVAGQGRGTKTGTQGNVEIPSTYEGKPVIAIAPSGFQSYSAITGISIPSSIKKIPLNAFLGTGIVELVIPDSITEIENGAFQSCTKLIRVTMGNNVTRIGANAFRSCTSLSTLAGASIGNSVRTIGSAAFYGCRTLERVFIRKSVRDIEDSAFAGCSALDRINFESGGSVTIAPNAFPGKLAAVYDGPGVYEPVLKSGSISTWVKK